MKPSSRKISGLTAILGVALALGACSRSTRGPAPADTPAPPASANDSKSYGDTRRTTEQTGTSPSESPTGLSQDAKPGQTATSTTPSASTTSTPSATGAPTNSGPTPKK